jgi:hypothetical protein
MKRCRLIYRSKAKLETKRQPILDKLAATASKNNQRDGIVGVLILSGDQFLQVLEGPVRYVNQLYAKITQDSRHEEVELVSYEQIHTPYFFDWSMRLINLDNLPDQQKAQLGKKYQQQNGQLVIPDNPIQLYALLHDARELF